MRIAFISGMRGSPWGGSEILWSQAAVQLKAAGHQVFASVHGWPVTPEAVRRLRTAGIEVHERGNGTLKLASKIFRKATARVSGKVDAPRVAWDDARVFHAFKPDIVCLSQGTTYCAIEWMELCLEYNIPYFCISQANAEWTWPDDDMADRLARAHSCAKVSCFVSRGNLRLFEMQIAARLPNSRVVWNPFQIDYNTTLDWPSEEQGLKLACVGRLSMMKSQDLIMQVLARPEWLNRKLSVSFFGEGRNQRSFRRLSGLLGVEDRVFFHGQVDSVAEIWKTHHALLLPSRCEGLPLALIEAMLCARLSIVTDVAGHKEVVDDEVTGFIAAAPTLELVAEAMERAWQRRSDWAAMGAAASLSVRGKIPQDPVGDFVKLLMEAKT